MFNTKNDNDIKVEVVLSHKSAYCFQIYPIPSSSYTYTKMRFEDSLRFYMTLTGMTEQEVWDKIKHSTSYDEKNTDMHHRLIQRWIDRIL